jgi:hypothetical protein
MVSFVADLRERFPAIRGFVAAMVKAVQEALKNEHVLYPVEDALPYLREGAAVARTRSLPFWIFNLPPCVLPDLQDIVFSPYELDRTLDLETLEITGSSAANSHCVKGRACLDCTRFESCSGYLRAYEQRFGSAPFHPPPSLRRSKSLPDSLLRPPDRKLVVLADTAQAPRDAHPAPPNAIERMTNLLDRFAHPGWRVSGLEWDASAPLPRWVLFVDGPAGSTPLVVHLETADVPTCFLTDSGFSLSYRGAELAAGQERMLRALFAFLQRAGDADGDWFRTASADRTA